MRRLIVCLLVVPVVLAASQREKEPSLHGVSLGEPKAEVKTYLSKIATFAREDEGQEVWMFKTDPKLSYAIVGYDSDKRVRFVSLFPKQGQTLECGVLGDPAKAKQTGKPGSMQYTREIGEPEQQAIAIARGASADKLSLCSIKRVGAKTEEDEEEEREHRQPKH